MNLTRFLGALGAGALLLGSCSDGTRVTGPGAPADPAPEVLSDYLPPPTPVWPDCGTSLGYTIPWVFTDPATPPNGTYEVHEAGMSITISNASRADFDWASTFPVSYLIVQGTLTPEYYFYEDPGSLGERDVQSHLDASGIPEDIVHVHFCFLPQLVVTEMTAEATYRVDYGWAVEKEVDPVLQTGHPGQALEWTWTVSVTKTVSQEYGLFVEGTFVVANPFGPDTRFIVDDELTPGSVPATVTCDVDYVQDPPGYEGPRIHLLPHGETAWCTYSAWPDDLAPATNAVTAVPVLDDGSPDPALWQGVGEVPFTWEAVPVGPEEVTLIDHLLFRAGVLLTESDSWSYPGRHVCSTSPSDYGEDGSYSGTVHNSAVLQANGADVDWAHASTTYACVSGVLQVLKLTNESVDPVPDWEFALFRGPEGFGGERVGGAGTRGDPDGILEPAWAALRPDETYTLCELEVPAGWSGTWKVDTNGDGMADIPVTPYNPDQFRDPPEDLGNRCLEVGAGTDHPLDHPLLVEVGNNYPGGDPRQPSYWKAWSSCTGGSQPATAAANGGPDAGWFLMDDILADPGVQVGILAVATCPLGVSILEQRDVKSGKKMASDPAYPLAMHLLAARLNFAAGAGTCPLAEEQAALAQELLFNLGFKGEGTYLRVRDPDYALAMEMATNLESYNNGFLCGG
jgi:hypothetical protein